MNSHFQSKKKNLYSKHKRYPLQTLQCDFCYKQYKIIFGMQATNCAANTYFDEKIQEQSIYAAFGSDYDTKKFIVEKDMFLRGKNICDHCITKLLDEKKIVEDQSYNYWDHLNYIGNEVIELNEEAIKNFKIEIEE